MFTDLTYYLLLLVAAVCYRFAGEKGRTAVLAASGFAFYGYYARGYILLLLAITAISWVLLFMPAKKDGKAVISSKVGYETTLVILISVAVLTWFKYGKFLGTTVGLTNFDYPTAPLAISFFIFEFIHVAAEKRRGNIERIGIVDYFAFIFFFPTMIAGPIKRYEQFEKGIRGPNATSKDVLEGLFRIALGLFKKLVIADNINTVLMELAGSKHAGLMTVSVVLYGFRILLDFAGYSDIAIGSARMFGIKVPENFLYPYRQTNISNFWRHWHISLSTWLTDYVFIPLGGSRRGFAITLRNLVLVMIVSGFWHGAAWNFVLWGAWHGLLFVIYRLFVEYGKPKLSPKFVDSFAAKALSYVLTMVSVWFGWMLFMWPIDRIQVYLHHFIR